MSFPPRTRFKPWLTVRKLINSPVLSPTFLQIYCIGLTGPISQSLWIWVTICDPTIYIYISYNHKMVIRNKLIYLNISFQWTNQNEIWNGIQNFGLSFIISGLPSSLLHFSLSPCCSNPLLPLDILPPLSNLFVLEWITTRCKNMIFT